MKSGAENKQQQQQQQQQPNEEYKNYYLVKHNIWPGALFLASACSGWLMQGNDASPMFPLLNLSAVAYQSFFGPMNTPRQTASTVQKVILFSGLAIGASSRAIVNWMCQSGSPDSANDQFDMTEFTEWDGDYDDDDEHSMMNNGR